MGVFFFMSDPNDLTDAIIDAATRPAAISLEGESTTERSINELIAARDALNAQLSDQALAAGRLPFLRLPIRPPGPRGR